MGCAYPTPVVPIGLCHRIKSQATGEKLDRRQEGVFILATLRPIGLVRMIAVLAYMINPPWMVWSQAELPSFVRWMGVPIGVTAAGLLIVVFRTLGTNITDTVVTRANHSLVTRGPYRWVRHPFYLAFAMAIIANSLVTANGYLAATGLAAFVAIVVRTSIEERNLIARFGRSYEEYMRTTGRFLPRVGRRLDPHPGPLPKGEEVEPDTAVRTVDTLRDQGSPDHSE